MLQYKNSFLSIKTNSFSFFFKNIKRFHYAKVFYLLFYFIVNIKKHVVYYNKIKLWEIYVIYIYLQKCEELYENNVTARLIKNISFLRGIYGFTRLMRKTAVITVANGLHEPNESYPLIEREILTIDLIDFDVRHLERE